MIFTIFNRDFITQGGLCQIVLLCLSIVTVTVFLDMGVIWISALIRQRKGCITPINTYVSDTMYIYVRAIAPLLGILGTIHGIIRAFARMGGAHMLDFSAMATDVSMALYTTAYGIIVAIVCMLGMAINDITCQRIHVDD
ncbi:MotA/TolQ/ExbB proton channel family protein [Planctomycetota bacterium]